MVARDLVIEDAHGQALRAIRWQGTQMHIVERKDNQRIEIVPDLTVLDQKKVKYSALFSFSESQVNEKLIEGIALPRQCSLKLVTQDIQPIREYSDKKQSDRQFFLIWLILLLFGVSFLFGVRYAPVPEFASKEDLQKRIVKIIKKPEPVEKRVQRDANVEVAKVRPQKALKRMGALAALGSLSRSAQRGGLDLGAAQTSRGIGLGGTQGSGGTQTSLYAKGLVAAPLGTGGNIKGAGGYGTKGKGGGQAGYGSLSLVGSAGTEAVPLGREAIVDGGLDRDMIAEVVRRNQGQVMFCYEQGLQGDPSLSGRVAIKWTISGNGQVKTAQLDSSTLNSKIVEDCILARLKTWKFPLPQGGVDVQVSYPFMLKRAGQG